MWSNFLHDMQLFTTIDFQSLLKLSQSMYQHEHVNCSAFDINIQGLKIAEKQGGEVSGREGGIWSDILWSIMPFLSVIADGTGCA